MATPGAKLPVPERVCALAVSSALTAFATGLAALFALQLALPPSDTAHGASLADSLDDPFVSDVWWSVVLCGSVLGFVLAAPLLWRVKLAQAVPRVAGATLLAAGVGAFLHPGLMLFAPLLAGLAAMLWARRVAAWRL